jgi:hypothetical protein
MLAMLNTGAMLGLARWMATEKSSHSKVGMADRSASEMAKRLLRIEACISEAPEAASSARVSAISERRGSMVLNIDIAI